MQAPQSTDALRRAAAPRAGERRALVVGAAGALGAAVLEQALRGGRFAQVGALVVRPAGSALRGFVAVPAEALADGRLARGLAPDTAWVVFDRERRANGREDAFFRPQPEALPALAAALHEAGVRRLVVVLPHAPGLLPQALRRGLASLDEHAVAALGFEQLVFVRSAGATGAAADGGALHRLARLVLSPLRWMVPQPEQPLRAQAVAAFAVRLAAALAEAAPATRIVPPELLWQAAQGGDLDALAREWLASGRWTPATPRPMRM